MTEPLIYLPGMMCDARLFAPQIAELGGTVLPITFADNVADLARSVLAEAPDRFALAGLSMGGIVAMEVLRQAPGRVTRLALLDTNPLAETDAVKACRAPQIVKARAGQLDNVMRDEMKPNYLTNGQTVPASLICVWTWRCHWAPKFSFANPSPCVTDLIKATRCADSKARHWCCADVTMHSVLWRATNTCTC